MTSIGTGRDEASHSLTMSAAVAELPVALMTMLRISRPSWSGEEIERREDNWRYSSEMRVRSPFGSYCCRMLRSSNILLVVTIICYNARKVITKM